MRMNPKDLGVPPEEAGMVVASLMAIVVMEDMVMVMVMDMVMEDMDGGMIRKVVRAKKFQLFL